MIIRRKRSKKKMTHQTNDIKYTNVGKWFVGICYQCRDENKMIYAESEEDFSIIKGKPYHNHCAKLAGILAAFVVTLAGMIR